MSKLTKEAFAIMAICEKNKGAFWHDSESTQRMLCLCMGFQDKEGTGKARRI